jgi:hypothetical protein
MQPSTTYMYALQYGLIPLVSYLKSSAQIDDNMSEGNFVVAMNEY